MEISSNMTISLQYKSPPSPSQPPVAPLALSSSHASSPQERVCTAVVLTGAARTTCAAAQKAGPAPTARTASAAPGEP